MKKVIYILMLVCLIFTVAAEQVVTNFTGEPVVTNVTVTGSSLRNVTFIQEPYISSAFMDINNIQPQSFLETFSSVNQSCSSGILACTNANNNNYGSGASYDDGTEGDNIGEIYANFTYNDSFIRSYSHQSIYWRAKGDEGSGLKGVYLYCLNPSTSTYTLFGNIVTTTAYSEDIVPNVCLVENRDLLLRFDLRDNLIDGSNNILFDYELRSYTNVSLFLNTSVLFTNNTNGTTYNYTSLNFKTKANSLNTNIFYFNFSAFYGNTFETNFTINYFYNRSINVSVKDNETSTVLNPTCTYNSGSIDTTTTLLYFNSSLANSLLCTLAGYQNFTYQITPENSTYNLTMVPARLILRFYDEETDILITSENITLTVIQSVFSINRTTDTGNITLTDVQPAFSELRYSGESYRPRSYFVDVSGFNNVIDLYLIKNTSASLILFEIIDEKGFPVPNATFKVQRYFLTDNAYLLIGMEHIDENGQSGMYLVPNTVPYKFIVEKDGSVIFNSDARKIFTSIINIQANRLDDPLESHIKLRDGLTTNLTFNNDTKILSYFFNDASGIVTQGCVEVIREDILTETLIGPNCTSSSSATITLNLTSLIINDTRYVARGYVDTNTQYSTLYTDILNDFVQVQNFFENFGNFGLYVAYLFIVVMFFAGLPNFSVSVSYTILSMIVLNFIGISFFGYALIISIGILGVVIARGNKI